MKNKKTYLQNTSAENRDIPEDEIEDVLFTFLGLVNEERTAVAERRKNKFLELLAKLGPVEADKLMTALAQETEELDETTETSPTVGEVLNRFMDIQRINNGELASKLGTAQSSIGALLNEPYRVSEDALKDIAVTIATRHKINNLLVFRDILSTGYRLWGVKSSTAASIKLAARKKNT